MFRFKCSRCDKWHEGMPSFAVDAPPYYYDVPETERAERCELTTDTCIVDDEYFFVRGCVDIPVHGESEPFSWGLWVSLSRPSFEEFVSLFGVPVRDQHGPYFGWLSACLAVYPDIENLKTHVHIRNHGVRPYIELEPTDHPLAIEQREGISVERVAEIYASCMH
ncbi:MAG TPA: DUF2199 domain-containing protein [Sphingomonas sp.]|nr:DUF2199 domain-containing protein [Sphingomonas sp.]